MVYISLLAPLDSTAQTGHANGGNWQEEVYQKVKTILTYSPVDNIALTTWFQEGFEL